MLDQLTIIIITYKRYGFLKRLLIFFSLYQSKAQFLILDSSPEDPEDQELIKLLSQDNVNWIRYDSDIFFAHKIANGCEYINTDYAVLCADDDFLIPRALERCIDFLSEHQDYSSAHGLYFNHSSYEKTRSNNFRVDPLYEQGRSSEEKTSAERVTSYLGGITCNYPMYAVQRTPRFRTIWHETKQYVSDQGLSELFPCCLSFVYGKMKILPVFYSSREPNNYVGWYDEKSQAIVYSKEKIERAIKGLSKHLSEVDDLSLEEAENFSVGAFQDYLNRLGIKMKRHKHNKSQVLISFLKRIKEKLRIRTRLKGWMYYFFYQGCHPSIYPDYIEDFKKVKKAVLSAGLTFEELNLARRKIFYKESA